MQAYAQGGWRMRPPATWDALGRQGPHSEQVQSSGQSQRARSHASGMAPDSPARGEKQPPAAGAGADARAAG